MHPFTALAMALVACFSILLCHVGTTGLVVALSNPTTTTMSRAASQLSTTVSVVEDDFATGPFQSTIEQRPVLPPACLEFATRGMRRLRSLLFSVLLVLFRLIGLLIGLLAFAIFVEVFAGYIRHPPQSTLRLSHQPQVEASTTNPTAKVDHLELKDHGMRMVEISVEEYAMYQELERRYLVEKRENKLLFIELEFLKRERLEALEKAERYRRMLARDE